MKNNMINIEVERYETPKVKIFRTNGDYYDILNNEHEFNKFRNELLRQDATHEFYFMWEDIKILIKEDGNMTDFPIGLYDQVRIELCETFNIIKQKKLLKNKI